MKSLVWTRRSVSYQSWWNSLKFPSRNTWRSNLTRLKDSSEIL
jgi:hypothetical protein